MADANEQRAKMIANMPNATGKALGEWVTLIAASGPDKHGAIMKLLKGEHGVTHGYANLITHEFRSGGKTASSDDLLESQYAGAKAHLKPLYDAIISAVKDLGDDVEVAPKKSYVSLRRKKQFAIVQPSTKTRVDVGLNLKGVAATDRLEASGSFNAMVSHRVRLESDAQVDAQLRIWLETAYNAAG